MELNQNIQGIINRTRPLYFEELLFKTRDIVHGLEHYAKRKNYAIANL
jgi:hypothetical protein